jgi:hypothetical protein
MALFEFLMILLSIIVGLGLAEILTGFGRILREGRLSELSWIHAALATAIFFGLLQTFWESWGLRSIEAWTFPAMLLMLASPILLLTITHLLFPTDYEHTPLKDYYFVNPRLPWRLAALTVIVGTLFRPIAFGMPLFILDNASSVPMILLCVLLGATRKRLVHYIFVPLITIFIILDTLFINYMIR